MYEVGSKVIHPLYGLGNVEAVEEKTILGARTRLLVLGFGKLRVMVNPDQGNAMIRPPVEEDEVPEILDRLRHPADCPDHANRRHMLLLEKIKSGDVYELCDVVSSLSDLARGKRLTLKDQTMLEQSRRCLADELSYVTRRARETVEREIDAACGLAP